MRRSPREAARAYRQALALAPGLQAAHFNLGVVHQEERADDAAIAAYEAVLRLDARHVAAYKNLGEVLFAAGRFDAWRDNFLRFEANCPDALALAVQALEVSQWHGDFAGVGRYLDGLAREEFRAADETDLVDCLEQLLYLLLFFDVAPEQMLALARTYDAAARHVYGEPLPRPPARKPGRLRIGYLSADLRNHVMGKMMWQAIRHHDRSRFEIGFYSLSFEDDEWTERFRGAGDHFTLIADMSERDAAQRIAADDLDILVDLSTHTKGAKPGILAWKPARVQITHVASAGTVGLSAIDFKLTDHYADVAASQAFQIETMLPMAGCVYPFRHVAPAAVHPFHRERLGIPDDAVDHRRVRQRAQAVAALPRPVARSSGAHPACDDSHFRRPTRRRAGSISRSPAPPESRRSASCSSRRAATTRKIRHVTSSSTSCSIRCRSAASTARSKRSTWECRW